MLQGNSSASYTVCRITHEESFFVWWLFTFILLSPSVGFWSISHTVWFGGAILCQTNCICHSHQSVLNLMCSYPAGCLWFQVSIHTYPHILSSAILASKPPHMKWCLPLSGHLCSYWISLKVCTASLFQGKDINHKYEDHYVSVLEMFFHIPLIISQSPENLWTLGWFFFQLCG